MKKISFSASEEKSFENVHDDGRRTDGRTPDTSIYYKHTYEPGSGELKSAVKITVQTWPQLFTEKSNTVPKHAPHRQFTNTECPFFSD